MPLVRVERCFMTERKDHKLSLEVFYSRRGFIYTSLLANGTELYTSRNIPNLNITSVLLFEKTSLFFLKFLRTGNNYLSIFVHSDIKDTQYHRSSQGFTVLFGQVPKYMTVCYLSYFICRRESK